MASINDLAAAATIASSAVALQSSPTQQATQPASASAAGSATTPSSPPSAPPLIFSADSTSLPGAAALISTPPGSTPLTSAQGPPPAPMPGSISSTSTTPVLAAPQISPQNPAQAMIPAPPPALVSHEAEDGEPMTVDLDGATGPGADAVAPPQKKPVRGAFVVFEGMDRAGKTTQAKLLQQRCIEEGRNVKFMRFPDRTTPIGQMIDNYLKGQAEIEDHVIHLLFSANRWEALNTIQQALAAGTSVICDRYYHSGIVYSAAKQNPLLSLSWAKAPEIGLPRPDMVLFFDLDEQVARERGGWGGEIYEKGEMQHRVRELFWGLSMGDLGNADKGKDKVGDGQNDVSDDQAEFRQEEEDIQIVDANMGVEELAEKVWEVVWPRLEVVGRGELGHDVRVVK
ncbi:thymidylate kinase-domain-containing protein [Pseudomassariella vexata]|uniref:Thymidylate kinase n=1 Tax=Pseudomassariella vexata TaxID=1141098 RepID=A0A1Y2EJS4_9PEZI|nr:thymidylate kinase-domain-containing protein [Pseudomassariella vexata]ORY71526.1 thymidylate kinase-domain-containing protein [Pseudomassariella vexata]